MEAQLQELVPFLHDRNPQVRQIALANLLEHTPKDAPYRKIFFSGGTGGFKNPKENGLIRDLKILCRDQLATAHDAFRALVNLSDTPLLATTLSEPTFISFLVSYILNPQAICADLAAMLLSNLTVSSSACSALLSLKVEVIPDTPAPGQYYSTQSRSGSCPAPVPYPEGETKEVSAIPLLVDAFVDATKVGAGNDDTAKVGVSGTSPVKRKGELHFLASVFANLTVIPVGRVAFLTPYQTDIVKSAGSFEYPISKLVVFTEHENMIRRGGIASVLKNCAFNTPAHRALLSPDTTSVNIPPSTIEASGIDVLPYLLLPLAGPEEYELEDQELLHPSLQFLPSTKQRESDPTLRLTHIETLILLCTTRWGRDTLRASGVYEIVRTMHLTENVENVSEHVVRLVNLLKRDEGDENAGNEGDVPQTVKKEEEENLIQEI